MILADQITQHVVSRYLVPAWKENKEQISIRAGDVHKEMGLRQRMPAVCGVLGSEKFQKLARTHLVDQTGPHQGANAVFTFQL